MKDFFISLKNGNDKRVGMKNILFSIFVLFILIATTYAGWHYLNKSTFATDNNLTTQDSIPKRYQVGDIVDAFNNVFVYYNGSFDNVLGEHITSDGYNLGLKYQCVEFVKRYYYQCFDHRMPVEHGYAKEFFDKEVRDGYLNKDRKLYQFSNPGYTKPKIHDILVFDATPTMPYGHVAIISRVDKDRIEFVQQNPGPKGKSRGVLPLIYKDKQWSVDNSDILGWLRKPKYDDVY